MRKGNGLITPGMALEHLLPSAQPNISPCWNGTYTCWPNESRSWGSLRYVWWWMRLRVLGDSHTLYSGMLKEGSVNLGWDWKDWRYWLMLALLASSCILFFFTLSFLWAFWWPPSACEFANSLRQYWQAYLLSFSNFVELFPWRVFSFQGEGVLEELKLSSPSSDSTERLPSFAHGFTSKPNNLSFLPLIRALE